MSLPDPSSALRLLVGEDVSDQAFFDRYWERAPRVIRGSVERFEGLYSAERFWTKAFLREIDAARRGTAEAQIQFRIRPDQIDPLFATGFTVCANVSHDPALGSLLHGLKAALSLAGGPSFAKVYASPDGEGFALHSDPHHVFVLQLSGTKRWHYSRAPVIPSPTAGTRLHRDVVEYTGARDGEPVTDEGGNTVAPPLKDDFDEVTLEPGDGLYLPAGFWHRAEAIGPSVALSVSPPRSSVAEVVTRLVQDLLEGSGSEWRRDVAAPVDDATRAAARLSSCLEQLASAVKGMHPGRLVRSWADVVARERAGPELSAVRAPDVAKIDQLVRVDPNPLLITVDRSDDAVRFYQGGHEWTLPLEARSFVEELARHTRFSARDALRWDRRLGWPGAKEVLDQLLAAGIVRIATPPDGSTGDSTGDGLGAAGAPADDEEHDSPDR